MPGSTIAEWYGKSVFSFVRNCQIIFQSGCPILHSHQQGMRVLAAPQVITLLNAFLKIFKFYIGV